MPRIKHLRSKIISVCACLAGLHLLYLWRRSDHLYASHIATGSLGQHLSSGDGTALETVAGQHAGRALKPRVLYACIDSPAAQKGLCANALVEGRCQGDVLKLCQHSCDFCSTIQNLIQRAVSIEVDTVEQWTCQDSRPSVCGQYIAQGYCETRPDSALAECQATCGFCAASTAAPQGTSTTTTSTTCRDYADLCPYLAGPRGLCADPAHADWMEMACPDACDVCPESPEQRALSRATGSISTPPRTRIEQLSQLRRLAGEHECADYHKDCAEWAERHLCRSNWAFMRAHCKQSCGLCDKKTKLQKPVADVAPLDAWLSTTTMVGEDTDGFSLIVSSEISVTHTQVSEPPIQRFPVATPGNALNMGLPNCAPWVESGECTKNKGYMLHHCRASCGFCTNPTTASANNQRYNGQGGGRRMAGGAKAPVAHWHSSAAGSGGNVPRSKAWYVSSPPPEATSFPYFAQALAKVRLNNGVMMPSIGFGSAGLGGDTEKAISNALSVGYVHIDSAQAREWYREDLVGVALRKYLSANTDTTGSTGSTTLDSSTTPDSSTHSPAPRDRSKLFITTKIHPRHLGYKQTMKVFASSLVDLGTEYVDLLLLHYPSCWGDLCKPIAGDPYTHTDNTDTDSSAPRTWRETWRAFETLYAEKRVRAIGVSNFNIQELQELYAWAKVKPQVLQVHMDPLGQSRDLQAMCRKLGIQMVAYSSLGTQWRANENPVLNNPILRKIAYINSKSVAQVVLRWVLHMGVLVIPRSSKPHHMAQSLDILNFSLSEDEISQIQALDGTFKGG